MTAQNRKLRSLLIGSLLLNTFLLGAGAMHLVGHQRAREARKARHAQRAEPEVARPATPRSKLGPRPRRPQGPGVEGARGRPGRRGAEGDRPAHARLLRKMVRAMGGPRDPRAQQLLRESRVNMKQTRAAITAAQSEVERALLAKPYDEERLQRAISELNHQSQTAQKNAQDLLVRLASELTEEERAGLERASAAERQSTPSPRPPASRPPRERPVP